MFKFLDFLYRNLMLFTVRVVNVLVLLFLLVSVGLLSAPIQESLLINNNIKKVVYLDSPERNATGFFVENSKGESFILTNYHFCSKNKDISALTINIKKQNIRIIKMHKTRDLCLLSSVEGANPVTLSRSVEVFYRAPLYVLGYPLGYGLKLSKGYLIGVNGGWGTTHYDTSTGECKKEKLSAVYSDGSCSFFYDTIKTDIDIRLGNSGSPVFNIMGDVVGVIKSMDKRGWGTAVTSNDIINFIEGDVE